MAPTPGPGISANPVVGRASDRVVWQGGTAAFAETPEVYGAEHLLAARARDPRVAQRLFDRIAWWQRYSAQDNGSMDANPAPGNKAGGITTILEKSLGAIAKGGTTDLVEVVEYGEPMHGPGLVFMDTPGLRPGVRHRARRGRCPGHLLHDGPRLGVRLQAGAVHQGRQQHAMLAQRMRDDMDVNAGRVVDGTASVDEVGDELFELILEVASGRQPLSEQLGHRSGRVRALDRRRGHVARAARPAPRTLVSMAKSEKVAVMKSRRPSGPPKTQLEVISDTRMAARSLPSGARTWMPSWADPATHAACGHASVAGG